MTRKDGAPRGPVRVLVLGIPLHCDRRTVISHVVSYGNTHEFHFLCARCGLIGPRDVIEKAGPVKFWRIP